MPATSASGGSTNEPPSKPATSAQPENVRTSATILRFVTFSLKKSADISMTNSGEVYSSTTAIEASLMVMQVK